MFLFFITACGGDPSHSFHSLADDQPQVVSIVPADGATFAGDTLEVTFSQPVDSATVTAKSFLVTAVDEGNVDTTVLWDKAKKDQLPSHPGEFEFSEDQKTIRFKATENFPSEVRCGILITPAVLSAQHLPLNQTPNKGPTPFFSSFYAERTLTAGDANNPETVTTNSATQLRPDYLQLNEVFYDTTGADTNGDLFVELLGEPERNLSNYRLYFISGDDGRIVDSLTIPSGMKTNSEGFFVLADAVTNQPGITHVLNADWVTNFDPPNGPDCVQLVDPDGHLVDALGYGTPLVLRAQNNLFCYEGTPAVDAPSGSSLTRLKDATDSDDNARDWRINPIPLPGGDFEESAEEEEEAD